MKDLVPHRTGVKKKKKQKKKKSTAEDFRTLPNFPSFTSPKL